MLSNEKTGQTLDVIFQTVLGGVILLSASGLSVSSLQEELSRVLHNTDAPGDLCNDLAMVQAPSSFAGRNICIHPSPQGTFLCAHFHQVQSPQRLLVNIGTRHGSHIVNSEVGLGQASHQDRAGGSRNAGTQAGRQRAGVLLQPARFLSLNMCEYEASCAERGIIFCGTSEGLTNIAVC